MRQRLGIAQAILHKPKLLVLDEPTNGLDPDGIKQMRDIFKRITREDGASVLVSSHMLAELDLMCDRIAIIDRGRVADIKTMNEIRNVAVEDNNEYELECSPADAAAEILDRRNIQFTLKNNEKFTILCRKSEIPSLLGEFTSGGVAVYAVVPKVKTLEEAYMETTSHNVEGGVGV